MKFVHTPTAPDGGGTLAVIAENSKEVVKVLDHFRVFDKSDPEQLVAMSDAIKAGHYTHVSNKGRDWYEVESALDHEFSKPYEDWLGRLTGFEGTLPDLLLTGVHPRRLCHTHITDECYTQHGHICFKGYVQSQDWNCKTALERSFDSMLDYVEEDFGTRPHEPEFVPVKGGGLMKHNPNYLKRHRAKPAASCGWLKEYLFDWWFDVLANDRQKNVISAAKELKRDYSFEKHVCHDYKIYALDPKGTCNYDGNGKMVRVYSWDEFRKLV